MPERVSVIIPSYNRAYTLPRALHSVLAQTRPADEIIVVDDGSDDGTATLLARDFPAVRCIRQPRAGVSAARNAGIACSSGRWLAFLDSDDEWLPAKLAEQLAAVTGIRGCRLAHCDEIWIRNGRRVNPMRKHRKSGGWIFERCLPMCRISPSAALIDRALLDDIGAFDEDLPACEDYDLWLRATCRYPVLFLNRALVIKHGGHRDQLSRRHGAMDRFRIQALLKLLEREPLSAEQRMATISTLLEKIDVYANGAARRGRHDEAARYRRIGRRFSGEPAARC